MTDEQIKRYDFYIKHGSTWGASGEPAIELSETGDFVKYEDHVAALQAASAAPAQTQAPEVRSGGSEVSSGGMSEWQQMETAPKDGSEIIGWTEDAGRVICHWGKHNHVPLYGWIRRVELYGEEVDGFDPELWMPLAAAPIAHPTPTE